MSLNEHLDLEKFEDYIVKFKNHIKTHLSQNRDVYLIALSRKMPRVISWAQKHLSNELERADLNDVISKCEYTTELALPLVLNKNINPESYIIILDDAIIKGETLTKAASDVYHITGIKPDAWCFYGYGRANYPQYVNRIIFGYGKPVDMTTACENLEFITRLICKYELPTDIEFPILHYLLETPAKGNRKQIIETLFENIIDKIPHYNLPGTKFKVGSDWKHVESTTVLTDSASERYYNNDFSKIRIFKYPDEWQFACFAPNVLSNEELNSENLFITQSYAIIWNTLLQAINACEVAEKLDTSDVLSVKRNHGFLYRRDRLKMIMACYLFSLSSAIRMLRDFCDDDLLSNLKVRLEDISLIIGKQRASAIVNHINQLVINRQTSTSPHSFVLLPDILVEDSKFQEYITNRSLIAHERSKGEPDDKVSETAEDILMPLFTSGYRILKGGVLHGYDEHYYENSPQESLSSLFEYVEVIQWARLPETKELVRKRVNEFLDYFIDLGFVIPRYQRVANKDNKFYWRRYFHASHLYEFQQVEKC